MSEMPLRLLPMLPRSWAVKAVYVIFVFTLGGGLSFLTTRQIVQECLLYPDGVPAHCWPLLFDSAKLPESNPEVARFNSILSEIRDELSGADPYVHD